MNAFLTRAQKYLESLSAQFEQNFPHSDIDLNHQSLTIEVTPNHIFLISLHSPLEQLWLSSPVSGAHHFFYDSHKDEWFSTRDDTLVLKELLNQELTDLMNEASRV